MNVGPIHFSSPEWLLALPAAGYLAWLWRRFIHVGNPTWPQRLVPYLRGAALVCLVLILAGTQWMSYVPGVDLHVLIDRSASVGARDRQSTTEVALNLAGLQSDRDRLAFYSFGRGTVLESRLGQTFDPARPAASPDPTATNIEAALGVALRTIEPESNSRILLLSDGIETVGEADRLIPSFTERGIPIDVFALQSGPEYEVAVDSVNAPRSVGPGEPYAIRAVLTSTSRTPAHITLYRDGTLLRAQERVLDPGRNLVVFDGLVNPEDARDGAATYEVRVTAQADTFLENNVGYAVVHTQGTTAVLVLSNFASGAEFLQTRLEDHQIQVDALTLDRAVIDLQTLSRYEAVVLHNVAANDLSSQQRAAVLQYVERAGGGLLVIGGDRSYGLGGYKNTSLERVLPVTMDAPQSIVIPSLALILVLDRSGSMAETQGSFSKLDLAKEASLGVLDVMHERDYLGVLAFDSTWEWIVRPQPVQNRVAFRGPITAITTTGGTNIGPAMQEAHRSLAGLEASIKHVLLLTDGISSPADFEQITLAMRADNITTSTVGIGRDADQALLQEIAGWGDGRFYYTEDIHSMPEIFTTESMMVSQPIRVDEEFIPLWEQGADFWPSAAALPVLGGHVITTPKPAAAVHLRGPDDAPLLATWRHGLGRTAAFTSDVVGEWALDWITWEGSSAFWSQLVRWLMRTSPTDGLLPHLALDGSTGYVTLDAVDPDGRYINFASFEAHVTAPGGAEMIVPLDQVGPGRYASEFPARTEGIYVVNIRDRSTNLESDRASARATTSAALAYPEEFRILRPETGLLYRLAQSTGGTIIRSSAPEELAQLFTHPLPARRYHALAPLLFALAFFAFFADVVARYLTADGAGVVRQGVRDAVGRLSAGTSPEERLEARMQAERAHLERVMAERERSMVGESARSAGAGRYLAERRKNEGRARDGAPPDQEMRK